MFIIIHFKNKVVRISLRKKSKLKSGKHFLPKKNLRRKGKKSFFQRIKIKLSRNNIAVFKDKIRKLKIA